ncbi:MAG: hypothetical protein RBG13Loki_1389 [Promethearchaeota archaeon CR_4]|nr:MAG: hypothetical protein RBG13Loki_1389 [Candidatus Lokiarchaeota archaeon CR_4]
MVTIRLTRHAEEKLERLKAIGITREKIIDTLSRRKKIREGQKGRKIIHAPLAENLIMRVVYEEIGDEILVITVYPARKERYE